MSQDNTLFHDLSTIEEDTKKLESIDRLQQAFRDVRQSYREEYRDSMTHVLGNIKKKMKKNHGMVEAVNDYVQRFVPGNRQEATEELYNLLAAEMLHTLQALQHTNCAIM